jgi:DNA-binding NarL/FixJ family response regulator
MLGVDEPALPLAPLLQKPMVALVWEGNVGQGVLLEAVGRLQQGQSFVDPDVRRLVEDDLAIAGSLTAREREVLALLTEGLTNRQIAERIVVAEVTARDHVQRILHKLAVADRTAAAVLGLRLGLVD